MSQLRTSLVLDLVGNLPTRANQFLQNLKRMGSEGSRAMGVLQRGAGAVGRGLDALGNRYTAILGGATSAAAVRGVVSLDERLTMLRLNSNSTREQMERLKGELFATAQAADIRVDPEQLLAGVERIVEFTGDLGLAQDNLRTLGLVMRASAAEGADVGATLSDIFEKFKVRSSKDMLAVFDTLRTQGEAGKFTLKDLATQGSRLTNAFAGMGYTGSQAAQQMGAWSQIALKATASPEQATTALEAITRDLVSNGKDLAKMGIQIWNPEDLKNGRYVARQLDVIVNEILQKTGGDPAQLQKIFGEEAMRPIKFLIDPANRSSLQTFLKIQGDGSEITRESADAARDLTASLTALNTAWRRLADSTLSKPIRDLAGLLDKVNPETANTALQVGAGTAATLGGAVLARKTWLAGKAGVDAVRWLATGVKGGAAAGAEAASGLSAAGVGRLGRLGAGVGTVLTGYELAKVVGSDSLTQAEKINRGSGLVGGLAGGLAGAKLGAMAGTFIAPGAGTLVGGLAGGVLGSIGGESLFSSIAEALTAKPLEGKVQVEFANPPPGMRLTEVRSTDNLDLAASIGLRAVKP